MLYSLDQQSCKHPTVQALAEPTDEQLMEQIKQGDEKALESLQQRHRGLMTTIISRVMGNDHDTDDIMQECVLQIWQRANTYSVERGHALGWIVTLARRRAIDRVRRRSSYLQAQERFREETTAVCESGCQGSDEQVAQSDRAEVVARLIERLPEPQQEVVRLTFYRGMSQRQIAAHTGIPLGTIKTRLELAFRKLRCFALAFGELQGKEQTRPTNVISLRARTAAMSDAA